MNLRYHPLVYAGLFSQEIFKICQFRRFSQSNFTVANEGFGNWQLARRAHWLIGMFGKKDDDDIFYFWQVDQTPLYKCWWWKCAWGISSLILAGAFTFVLKVSTFCEILPWKDQQSDMALYGLQGQPPTNTVVHFFTETKVRSVYYIMLFVCINCHFWIRIYSGQNWGLRRVSCSKCTINQLNWENTHKDNTQQSSMRYWKQKYMCESFIFVTFTDQNNHGNLWTHTFPKYEILRPMQRMEFHENISPQNCPTIKTWKIIVAIIN